MEPWEDVLDLDDSDIPNLIRPCKRQHSQSQTQTQHDACKTLLPSSFHRQPSNPNFSIQLSPAHSHPPAESQPHFQSQSPLPPRVSEPAAAVSSSVSPIPGPAGAMQAAMHRRNKDCAKNLQGNEVQSSTQEYMRRVEENADEDFANNCLWISALEFLERKGVTRTKPLSDVKKHGSGYNKIDMVVAIVKSCTPNGFGDMMVELKDPTDTIAANIHRKVLVQGGCTREMLVGSVLILQEVSVFCPSHRSYYLSISLSNLVEVFSKETAGHKSNSAPVAKNDSAAMSCSNSSLLEMPELLESSGRTEEHPTEYDQQNCNLSENWYVNEPTGMEECVAAASPTIVNNAGEIHAIRDSARDYNNMSNKPAEEYLVDLNFKFSSAKYKQTNENVALDCTQTDIAPCRSAPMTISNQDVKQYIASEQGPVFKKNCTQEQCDIEEDDQFVARENTVQIGRIPENSRSAVDNDGPVTSHLNGFKNHIQEPPKGLIQQWTDEQLDILDMDYDF